MKFAKLSLAALMAMGIAASAADVKVDGSAKLYYGTADAGDADIFSKEGAYGDAAVRVGLTAENMPAGLTGRISMTYLTTMGLEGTLVNMVWAGLGEGDNADLDGIWFDEMYLKGTLFDKTTVIAGRQYLDTPMVFSEKWNIVSNSYDAAVLVDQHIEKTALVAAWVWRSNVNGALTVSNGDGSFNDGFEKFGPHGAYAFGAVTSLIPYTTAQAWYYNVDSVADAYWLQADVAPEVSEDVKVAIGGQFAGTSVKNGNEDATAWAAKLGLEFSGLKLSGAYSSVDKGDLGFANVGGSQTKLYTEAWWNYGYVGAPDTDALNIAAEYSIEDIVDLGAYYTATDSNDRGADLTEFTVTAGKSFGAFDTMLAYIYTDAEDQNNNDSFNTLQVYLNYNF